MPAASLSAACQRSGIPPRSRTKLRMSAIPVTIAVAQNQRKIFRNKLRMLSLLPRFGSRHELVTGAAHSLDSFSRRRLSQFLAQVADVDVDHAIERSDDLASQNGLSQLLARDYVPSLP